MEPFTKRVIGIVRMIPEGRIMTYGQLAKCAGNSRGARQVARILHSMSKKYNLPWHRVINSQGRVSEHEGSMLQKNYLQDEGIAIVGGKINLREYLYEPDIQH